MSFPNLFSSFQLRDLTVKNRIAMAPMTRGRSGVERIPNELMAEYYRQRSDAGLIITEATVVSEQGIGWNETPGIYTDEMRDGWKLITDAIHEVDGKVFLQLWHCGRASHSTFHNGERAVSASANAIDEEYIHTPEGKLPHEVPRALETDEIPMIVDDYADATRRAAEAGFDGVEIHAANGYLINQFLESKTNQRDDRYGGSIENRYRFLGEIVDATTSVWSPERVAVRLSPNGVFNGMGSPEYRELYTYAAQQLDRYGLAYLHVMDGLAFGFHELGSPMTLEEFRNIFRGPLMGNCGYDAETAEAQIESGNADLIAIGRPFLSNPDYVERIKNGWPLAEPADQTVWSSPTGAEGYTDFPAYQPVGV
ncbi:alkene reductase [Thalassoglobus sp. JC818]|uniref:alkene reductase n=1 Tax=Thalassoglobus sp. JC818 TaxID=3232136 RepID=UPI00345ACBB6